MAGNNVWDDLKQAGNDLINDPTKVPGDLAKAVHDALFNSAYQPGITPAAFNAMAGGAGAGVDIGKVAGAAFAANFIENTVFTTTDQSANISNADAAIGSAQGLISSGNADASTIGQLLAAYGNLHGFNSEVWAAQGRLAGTISEVQNKIALRDAANKSGASVSETKNFNTVDDYLAFKKAEKEKRESIQPA